MFKNVRTGSWEFNYPKQNVKIVILYEDFNNNPKSETYYTLGSNKLFDGEFVFTEFKNKGTQERRIRDGLRNGNTIYYDIDGNKLKKEKYKDGILKE
jgi:antitoxin component YwqK of YwqJK toxin-antitoxin module